MDGADAFALARARAGHPDAFRDLVERHSRAVFRVAYRLTGSEADAEDVVQETFLRAYTQLDRFEGRAAVSTWLHRIAVNCAVDLLRRRKPQETSDEAAGVAAPSADPGPEQVTFGGQIRDRIAATMAALTPLERAAFTLRHLEQRSIEEISEALGLKSSATRHSIFRAVAKMRRALAPLVRTTP